MFPGRLELSEKVYGQRSDVSGAPRIADELVGSVRAQTNRARDYSECRVYMIGGRRKADHAEYI